MRRKKKEEDEFFLRYLKHNARGLPGAGAPQTPPPPPPPRGRLSFSLCMGARLLLEYVLLLERVVLRECTSEYSRAVSAASLSLSLSLSLSICLSLSDLQSSI
jgi:hypothetical protein